MSGDLKIIAFCSGNSNAVGILNKNHTL